MKTSQKVIWKTKIKKNKIFSSKKKKKDKSTLFLYLKEILDHSERTFFCEPNRKSKKKESPQKKSVAGLDQEHRVLFQRGKFDLADSPKMKRVFFFWFYTAVD